MPNLDLVWMGWVLRRGAGGDCDLKEDERTGLEVEGEAPGVES